MNTKEKVEVVEKFIVDIMPGGGFHGGENQETLPGGGFHGGENQETLPGGGFHSEKQW